MTDKQITEKDLRQTIFTLPSLHMQFRFLCITVGFLLIFCISGFSQQPTVLRHGGSIQTVEFSPVDASLIASAGSDNAIKLWNLQDNTATTLTGHTDQINTVAFSPNGQFLVSGGNDQVLKLWDVHDKQNFTTLIHIVPGGGPSNIKSVVFSPNGQILASAGYKSIKLWDVDNWIEIATYPHDDWVHSIVFSPNGQLLAAVDGKRMKIWDVKKQEVIARLEGDINWIGAIAFSPDSRTFASAGSEGKIKLWSTLNWEVIGNIKDFTSVSDLAFSPDGKHLASAGYAVNLWSIENGQNINSFTEHRVGYGSCFFN